MTRYLSTNNRKPAEKTRQQDNSRRAETMSRTSSVRPTQRRNTERRTSFRFTFTKTKRQNRKDTVATIKTNVVLI